MHTVLRVDLQSRRIALPDDFIHTGRAVSLLGRVIDCEVGVDRNARILQLQMTGLLFFVVGIRQEDGRQAIKGEDTIGFGIADGCALGGRLELAVVGRVVQGPGRFAAEQALVDTKQNRAHPQTFAHVGLEVARLPKLGVQPAFLEGFGVGRQRIAFALGTQRRKSGFGDEHAGLDRTVCALDACRIEEAGVATDQRAAREDQFR